MKARNDFNGFEDISDDDFTEEELDLIYGTHYADSKNISCAEDKEEKNLEEMGAY